jgi:putative FmdB family regulatory protein
MPIYEYRCSACGFQQEFLQKVSDPRHTVCPDCGKEAFQKMLTAAGFQLKGSGWYATDFKNGNAKPPGKAGEKPKTESPDPSASDSKSTGQSGSDSKSTEKSGSEGKSTSESAPACT